MSRLRGVASVRGSYSLPRYGFPFPVRSSSLESVLVLEPTLGIDVSQPSVDAPLGSTPSSDNYIMWEGGLEPRPMLSVRGTGQGRGGQIVGIFEASDTSGNRFPMVSTTTRPHWYSNGSWSALSYVSANGINDQPSGAVTDYWDATQIYSALTDQHIVVWAIGSYETLYCNISGNTLFSTVTAAPKALRIAAFDNHLVALNVVDPGSNQSAYVQRVQWSDRGDPFNWTTGLSGFEDLLTMRGMGTRILAQDQRLLVFSNEEVWQGFPRDFPFVFSFHPLDRNVGCPYPWTIAETPQGTAFLSDDYNVWLLPKGGGAAQPIGRPLHRLVRTNIDQPQRAWAAYDDITNTYQLYYPIRGGSGYPQRMAWLNLAEGSWAPQSLDRVSGGLSLTRGLQTQLSSAGTTWSGLAAASIRWADLNMTWAQLAGASEERAVLVGSSGGTAYYFNSNATSDAGIAVESRWRSTGLGGFAPDHTKTITQIAVDYQADSSSSLTVRASQNQGATFDLGTRVNMPTTSTLSQAIAHVYTPARYPMIEVTSEGQRYRLFRFFVTMRRGGR